MTIDSRKYNGMCSCGQPHMMTTEFCVIEQGCSAKLNDYLKEYGLNGFGAAIYDSNTYNAEGLVRPTVSQEIVLPSEGLHSDDHGVALALAELSEQCDYLIAIGSGTVHDITRYCANEKKIPFVSCPTAASVDGFCPSVAAMTWHGFKKTMPAVAPKLVVADLNVISKAPLFLAKSGFGDMMGKFIALSDWKIAHLLTGEYFCERIYGMTMEATKAVIECAEGIKNGEPAAYEKLAYGLLLSGLAMQMLGNSRCASGAEHHISHLIEMRPSGLNARSDALHGEKVGVGTLIACREYHRLKSLNKITWRDYPEIEEAYIRNMFGEALSDSIIKENAKDSCAGITAAKLEESWESICAIIDDIPSCEEMLKIYEVLGVKSTLNDIGVADDMTETLKEYSPLVRNRLTLMRLRRAILREEA